LPTAVFFIGLCASTACQAAWFDSAWSYRRGISITWDDLNPSGEDLASAVFYTDGHALPDGQDVRVATEDGKMVASHVLMVGPGDKIRVVFSLQKGVRDYEIYFGNPHPQSPPPELADVHYKSGLLLETRAWTGGAVDNFNQIQRSWDRSQSVLGKMMVGEVFMGYNAFGPQEQWISKFSGSLFAPQDGDYLFAMAADDDAALYIDQEQTLFAPLGGGDIRYHTTLHLLRGRHDLIVYHVNKASVGYVSLGWRPPEAGNVTVINRESFGICYSGLVGLMEQHDKTLVADFSVDQTSECFFNDSYSFRYHFSAKGKGARATSFAWDFGDGQTSAEPEVDHVYLVSGIYPVKLTGKLGENSDTQTSQLAVDRNYAHITEAHIEPPVNIAAMTDGYSLIRLSAQALLRGLQLQVSADRLDAAVPYAKALAGLAKHPDADASLAALVQLQKRLIDAKEAEKAVTIWDGVPTASDLQPAANRHAAELALWWTGDFEKAVSLLKPLADHTDPATRQMYAQALLLAGNAAEGRKILDSMNSPVPPARRAALSGAAARSVEFFITEKETDAGEEAWERWQAKFPADFLEGYSVMLRTKLMELRNRQSAAAHVAEAFAAAVPLSPYAPQLLDRASKLLAGSDPARSAALRQLLKQKYPEDPLSQN
jgi:PKD repeat protein